MAKITVDGEVFDYDPNRMLNTEAIALQKVTGMRIPEWSKALEAADAYALTALVWLLWRRAGREVPFDQVEFDIGAMEMDLEEDESLDPTDSAEATDEAEVEVLP